MSSYFRVPKKSEADREMFHKVMVQVGAHNEEFDRMMTELGISKPVVREFISKQLEGMSLEFYIEKTTGAMLLGNVYTTYRPTYEEISGIRPYGEPEESLGGLN